MSEQVVLAPSDTSSLIISCQPTDWATVQGILDKLKVAAATLTAPTTRIIPLKFAKAVDLSATLMRVYPSTSRSRGRSRTTTTPTVPVVIAPSERTNSLLVSASSEDHEAIAALVKSMDVAATAQVDPVRIVTIKSADAKKLADTLKVLIGLEREAYGLQDVAPPPAAPPVQNINETTVVIQNAVADAVAQLESQY